MLVFSFQISLFVPLIFTMKIIEKTSNNTSCPTRLDLMTLQLGLFLLLTVKYGNEWWLSTLPNFGEDNRLKRWCIPHNLNIHKNSHNLMMLVHSLPLVFCDLSFLSCYFPFIKIGVHYTVKQTDVINFESI